MPYSYDEQAKEDMLDRFIAQLNTSCEKADPDEASADLKYTRALQRNRLLKTGVTMSVDYSHDYHKMIHGIAWKMDVDTRYVTRIPFHAVNAKISYFLNGKLKKKSTKSKTYMPIPFGSKGKPTRTMYALTAARQRVSAGSPTAASIAEHGFCCTNYFRKSRISTRSKAIPIIAILLRLR